MNEKCEDCYWWDVARKYSAKEDTKKGKTKKTYWFADCCFGAPGDRSETIEMRQDLFCSEYLNREESIVAEKEALEAEE